ncbi:hypothetical protein [Formosa sp. S-31]|uniref:hypothetical protein n=1 Tax=Formosa sp. S-31 TaxID=2790949 RepID=UPI003EBB23C6
MKTLAAIVIILCSSNLFAQLQIKNYTNADLSEQQTVEQVVNWIQYDQHENIYPHIIRPDVVDKAYLNIESGYLNKTYPKNDITSQSTTQVKDETTIVWYERNIFKERKKGLKQVYQIYVAIDMSKPNFEILDLFLRKGKQIKHRTYQ